jgi:hypothetical protein
VGDTSNASDIVVENADVEIFLRHAGLQRRIIKVKVKRKSVPLQAWTGPEGSRRLRFPFQDNWHMKVVRLSALRTSHFYPPGKIPGTHFC